MIPNEKLKNNRHFGVGTWISVGSPVITEVISNFPLDWILFDLEHGCMNETALFANLQAISRTDLKIIVRVGQFDEALIGRVLDWGADGIMMPHVDTPELAAACVKAIQYPPYGNRGVSSSARCFAYGARPPKDLEKWQSPLLLVQIEDYESVQRCDEIAAVEGVDVVFVGPRDLGADLSTRPAGESMAFDEALKVVARAALKNNRQAGILVRNEDDLPKFKQFGYTCLAAGSDLGIIRSGYRKLAETYRLI